jgi:hypothetical protein
VAARAQTRRRRRVARRAFLLQVRRVVWAVTVGVVAGLAMYALAMSGVVKLLEDPPGEPPGVSAPTAP